MGLGVKNKPHNVPKCTETKKLKQNTLVVQNTVTSTMPKNALKQKNFQGHTLIFGELTRFVRTVARNLAEFNELHMFDVPGVNNDATYGLDVIVLVGHFCICRFETFLGLVKEIMRQKIKFR